MNRLRNRLILVYLAATLVPFGAIVWIAASLFDRSLQYASTRELDEISKSLERTGRELYQRARADLKAQAIAGRLSPARYVETGRAAWPAHIAQFFDSGAAESFALAGNNGDRLDYLVRRGGDVWVYSSSLGGVGMNRLTGQYRLARELVESGRARDLRRGFLYTYLLLAVSIWLVALALLVFLSHRISRPIQQLTAGLSELASGNPSTRVAATRNDEVGQAIHAFNHMASQLQESRERLVYLTQLASWQALARKMAHELKNSLTPIRLTMEELLARKSDQDPALVAQAAGIVVEEVESLERRVRAFSEFAAEPPVRLGRVNVNAVAEERIALLRAAHPELRYSLRATDNLPSASADEDLLKGVLTNLLENAADAAGSGGRILIETSALPGRVLLEVHDSGPGLSDQARQSIFEPAISFKKHGMGLGLSIARKSALLMGGDILLVDGKLAGAGFRVLLSVWPDAS